MTAPSPTPEAMQSPTVNGRAVTGKSHCGAGMVNSPSGSNAGSIQLTLSQLRIASELWFLGANTKEIADELALEEAEIWNRLDDIKAVKIAEAA